ncbi:MAG: hypothetical protein KDI55_00050 [Anaerolineae bacterium]|nr:hypothetical protein [Anaerolineae bacterium]
MRTAAEVMMRVAEYERRMVPMRSRFNRHFGEMLAKFVAKAIKRRRKSKGWRKHVRRMKANAR